MPIGATGRVAHGEVAEEVVGVAEEVGGQVEAVPAEADRYGVCMLEFIPYITAAIAPEIPVAAVVGDS